MEPSILTAKDKTAISAMTMSIDMAWNVGGCGFAGNPVNPGDLSYGTGWELVPVRSVVEAQCS
jgi:hypothetical protein